LILATLPRMEPDALFAALFGVLSWLKLRKMQR
jgi:hypothetical protein